MMKFRQLAVNAFLGFSTLLAAAAAHSETYPSKPIKVVVSFGAGSGSDVMARTLMQDVSNSLGVPIVIENKPGAFGSLAAEHVSRAAPDGYTLLLGTSGAHSANKWLFMKLQYEPIQGFTPIARTTNFPFALAVSGSSPATNLDEFLKLAQRSPDMKMGYGNSTGHIGGQHFAHSAGFKVLNVPYNSTPPALLDMAAGRLDFMIADLASSRAMVADGKVRLLALLAEKQSSLQPELPALGEKYSGFDFISWGGLLGPVGIAPDIVQKLSSEVVKSLNKPQLKQKFASMGLEAFPAGSEEFAVFLKEQEAIWGKQIKGAGITPQ